MKSFKDFIRYNKNLNENNMGPYESSNPQADNVNIELSKIFNYILNKNKNKIYEFIETFIDQNPDDETLKNMWNNIVSASQDQDLIDKPLGNLNGSANTKAFSYPNETQDEAGHFPVK